MKSRNVVAFGEVFMQRGIRNIFQLILLVIVILSLKTLEVEASTQYADQESNDSFAEAQQIGRNAMTPSNRISATTTLYRYVTGSLEGREDEDWYWLALNEGSNNYLTISKVIGTVYIDIMNEVGEVLYTFSYDGNSNSENVFRVDISAYGYYYIRLYHDIDMTTNYYFTIGNPEYYLGSYTHEFGKQTLPAKGTWEDTVNLGLISSIPSQAIGYKITILGCATSDCADRYYYIQSRDTWLATKINHVGDLAVIDASALAQRWGVRYVSKSKSNLSFSPQFTINYVYPGLPAGE